MFDLLDHKKAVSIGNSSQLQNALWSMQLIYYSRIGTVYYFSFILYTAFNRYDQQMWEIKQQHFLNYKHL